MRHILALFFVVVGVLLQGAEACVSGSCTNGMCSDIPSNNQVSVTGTFPSYLALSNFLLLNLKSSTVLFDLILR